MKINMIKDVPQKPGVYLLKNKNNDIIYIGKANRIKTRLTQYIKGSINSYKTQQMIKKVSSFDYILTKNAREALLLERNLISKHKPEYNILLMDDKRYPYIAIQLQKDGLSIRLAYRIRKKTAKTVYFGPFPTGYWTKRMADLLNRIAIYDKGLPKRNATIEYWENQFNMLKKMISNQSSLIHDLKVKMIKASNDQKYEIASDIKATLEALNFSKEKQGVTIVDQRQIDVIVFYQQDQYLSYAQAFYRQGNLLSIKSGAYEISTSIEDSTRQFVLQFYANHLKPELLLTNIPIETEDINIQIPIKGEKKQIIDIALENAKDNIDKKLRSFIQKERVTKEAWQKLKTTLHLAKLKHLLMVDNSNQSNQNLVSAIVSYRNGIKNKTEYKRFNLQKAFRKADVEYMKQAVSRYFNNANNPIPDLFIVDGGVAQVNEVKKIIPHIPVIGLVKNDQHITDSLIDLKGEKIKIIDRDLLSFLRGVQHEVDRFAKSLYRKRSVSSTLEGKLLSIKGVGNQTEKRLLDCFGSYAAIYNASKEELEKVVSEHIAISIKEGL